MKKPYLVSTICMMVIALDLITKYIADTTITPYEPVDVLPFFSLVNVENTGAAFSMLSGMGNAFFIGIATFAIAFIIYLLVKTNESPTSLSLILGGAIGNLADRIYYGHVRDFIDIHAGTWHWPAFNIADSALTLGLCLLLVATFRPGANKQATKLPSN